jgi:hypothetical protein
MVKFDSDEQEVMSVTYDRPELVNKVKFRRSLSTGHWEICTDVNTSHSDSSSTCDNVKPKPINDFCISNCKFGDELSTNIFNQSQRHFKQRNNSDVLQGNGITSRSHNHQPNS